MQRASLPSEKAFQTREDALFAIGGLSFIFLSLVCIFNSGAGAFARAGTRAAHDNRNYNVSTNGNVGYANRNVNAGGPERGQTVLRGRVTYADSGQPVRRAKVHLFNEGSEGQKYSATNRNGEFLFRDLGAGRYFVVVESPGVISPFIYMEDNAGQTPFARLASGKIKTDFVEANVTGTGDAFIEVRARRGGALTGRVTYEDGSPVGGARLNVFRRHNGTWALLSGRRGTSEMAVADARGVYRVSGLPAGEYVVRASELNVSTNARDEEEGAYGDASLFVNYHPDASSLRGAQVVKVTAGQETGEIDIVFPERPLHRITGTVAARRDNLPLGGVVLKLEPRDDESASPLSQPSITQWSDADGQWSVAGVPDGVYRLTVSRYPLTEDETGEEGNGEGEESSGRTRFFVATELDVKVEGRDIKDFSIKLTEAGTVSGRIMVEGRKKPAAPATVVLVPLTMRMRAPGGRADAASATPRPTAAPAAHDGAAPLVTIESLHSMLGDDYESPGYATYYEEDTGEFTLWRVPPGSGYVHVLLGPEDEHYVKSIAWKGVDLLREPLRARDGDEIKDVRILLSPDAAFVAGRVLSGPGGGSAGSEVRVVLVPADALRRRVTGATRTAQTDAEGRFRLSAAPGEYFIVAVRRRKEGETPVLSEHYIRELAPVLRRITLRPKQQQDIDVVLPEGR